MKPWPVERIASSIGGFVFDATGDGTADDVFVANLVGKRSLGHDGAGGWAVVERLRWSNVNSRGGFVLIDG